MSIGVASFSVTHWISASISRVIEAPGNWLTNFFDSTEDVWAADPLLSDDDTV